ncbi:hypothetical protein EC991_008424 [Linnemannia zychae]|nr:hypothetical protein EC991_008424 [Linnemannia zychae]
MSSLDPLRIAAIPDVTLDVVVTEQQSEQSERELLIESPQKRFPNASEASDIIPVTTTNGTPATTRRNPAGGLVEEAMDAYRNNENPGFGPRLRGPQAAPSPIDETPPASHKSMSSSEPSSLQEPISTNSSNFHEAMETAKLGDKEAQYTLGKMYYCAREVQQDYSAAMLWYTKAASQGHVKAQNAIGYTHQLGRGVLKITLLPCSDIVKRLTKDSHPLKLPSAVFIKTVMGFHKITGLL